MQSLVVSSMIEVLRQTGHFYNVVPGSTSQCCYCGEIDPLDLFAMNPDGKRPLRTNEIIVYSPSSAFLANLSHNRYPH